MTLECIPHYSSIFLLVFSSLVQRLDHLCPFLWRFVGNLCGCLETQSFPAEMGLLGPAQVVSWSDAHSKDQEISKKVYCLGILGADAHL